MKKIASVILIWTLTMILVGLAPQSTANNGNKTIRPNQDSRFTALDDSGASIDVINGVLASPPTCTQDKITGLVWELKTEDFGLRDKDWTYTWYNPDANTSGGDLGSLGSATCGGTLPENQCNTQAYITMVNTTDLCGANDWRLPTFEELQSIVQTDTQSPSIDTTCFSNTLPSTTYWTATTKTPEQTLTWSICFDRGISNTNFKTDDTHAVRLVHGEKDASHLLSRAVRKADLVVAAITAGLSAQAGGKLTVSTTVKNQGTANAGKSRVTFYLSTNDFISQSDISTTYGCDIPALSAGNRSICSGNIVIPPTTTPGTYYLGAYADNDKVVSESNENNNGKAASHTTIIGGGSTDLVVTNITTGSSAQVGGGLVVSATVKNQGTSSARDSRVTFYLSNDNFISQSDTSTTYGCAIPTLPAGNTNTCSENIVIPSTTTPGTYYVGAYADDGKVVSESDESNNGKAASNTTIIGGGSINNPPVAKLSYSAHYGTLPVTGHKYVTVYCNASQSYDPEGGALKYYWMGTQGYYEEGGKTRSFYFVSPGKVTLKVQDEQGATSQTSISVSPYN